jgi:quercetin dioxygenase-like cupin family protein
MSETIAAKVKYLPANSGRSLALLGHSLTFKDEPGDNGDAFLLWEGRIPEGGGVPAHNEHNHEAFYVLDGILEIEAEGVQHRLRPGDFLCIQPGTIHSLHNPGPGWLRTLVINSLGTQHVRFFTTLGQPIDDPTNPPQPSGPPDFERFASVARENGIDFAPPPAH